MCGPSDAPVPSYSNNSKKVLSPFDAQSGGQIGSVSICDVWVLPQKHWDLFIGVQPDAPGHQHRPVLVTSQLDVVGRLGALLLFLRHRCAAVGSWRHLQRHLWISDTTMGCRVNRFKILSCMFNELKVKVPNRQFESMLRCSEDTTSTDYKHRLLGR